MEASKPFDGAFDESSMVLTDVSDMAFVLMIARDGTCDMKAGDGISREHAAKWLRMIADSLDGGA